MKSAFSAGFSAASLPLQSAPSLVLRGSAQRSPGPVLSAFCCQPPHLQISLWLLLFLQSSVQKQLHTENFSDYVIDSYCLCLFPFICNTIPCHVHVVTCLLAALLLHRGHISFSLALSTWQIPRYLKR